MTREIFDPILGRMLVLRGAPDHGDEHFKAMADMPQAVLERAVDHALKTRSWFPTPAELRMDADASAPSLRPDPPEPQYVPSPSAVTRTIRNPFGGANLVLSIEREWRYDCERCWDTGTKSWWCGQNAARFPEMPERICGRRQDHDAHEWVERCDCWDFNPTLKRRRAALQKHYAEQPARASR